MNGFRTFLNQEFAERRRRNGGYSLRRFAKDLGQDPSALARLLHGKVPIGPHSIEKLGRALLLGVDEIEEFKGEAQRRRSRTKKRSVENSDSSPSRQEYQAIQSDTFRVISDWYHFAILELIHVKGFQSHAGWISQRLDVPVAEIRFALERLERLGLIAHTKKGYKDMTSGWSTNIAQPFFDSGHRRMQKQVLEKAVRALETVPVAKRDQSTITLAFPQKRMAEAKDWIKNFRRKFNKEFGQTDRSDSVYNLTIAFYPLAETEEE